MAQYVEMFQDERKMYSSEIVDVTTKLLQESGLDREENFQRLKILQSGHERMDFAYSLLKETKTFNEIVHKPNETKSNEKCLKLKNLGLEYMQSGQFLKTLISFTQSLTYAERNSSHLAVAYGERACLLFEKNYFDGSLEDIEWALQICCPKDMREKLLKLKAQSINSKAKQTINCFPLPIIKNKNSLSRAASASIEIGTNDLVGRHIIAAEDIKLGDVLIVEKSLVHTIFPESKYLHCHECLNLCYNLLPCVKCTNALYCGENCRQRAFSSYHKYECDVIPIFGELTLNVIKMVTIALNENDKEVQSLNTHRSERFIEVRDLVTNEEKRDSVNFAFPIIMACLAYFSLTTRTDILKLHSVATSYFKDLICQCLMIDSINSFNIKKVSVSSEHSEKVAQAIFSFSSLFNHSCAPNCQFFFYDRYLVIRAMKSIKKGEECNISYYRGHTYAKYGYTERQARLKDLFFFDCHCKACSEQWPTLERLPQGENLPDAICEQLTNIAGIDASRSKVLDNLLSDTATLLQKLEKIGPSQNLVMLNTALSKGFESMANKILEV